MSLEYLDKKTKLKIFLVLLFLISSIIATGLFVSEEDLFKPSPKQIILQSLMQGASTSFEPEYPNPVEGKIYEPLWGTVECRDTGMDKEMGVITFKSADESWWSRSDNYLYATVNCDTPFYRGCVLKIESIEGCYIHPTTPFLSLPPVISIDNQPWKKITDYEISLSPGTHNIKVSCADCTSESCDAFDAPHYTPKGVIASLKVPLSKLYVTAYGYAKSGWLKDSEGCTLTPALINVLPEYENVEEIKREVESLSPGESKSIIVGWRVAPGYGEWRVWNGQNVVCKPFDGLYSIKEVGTYGGKRYYALGSLILSRTSKPNFCCDTSECPSGYVCENFECVKKEEARCPLGECSYWRKGDVLSEDCVEEDGKFYLTRLICGEDLCIREEKIREVKCCPDYCARLPGYYKCDYDVGCVPVSVVRYCPPGYCCIGGPWVPSGTKENEYGCSPLKCCLADDPDPYRGICREKCINEYEICNDGIDNDGDGLVDKEDPDCQIKEIPPCKSCLEWFLGKFRKGFCIPDETKLKLLGISIVTLSQEWACPIMIIGNVLIVLLIIFVVIVLLKKAGERK